MQVVNKNLVKSSRKPTLPLKTRFPVYTNTKSIVVKVATILQEIAFNRLLMGFSILYIPLLVPLLIEQGINIINLSMAIKRLKMRMTKISLLTFQLFLVISFHDCRFLGLMASVQ